MGRSLTPAELGHGGYDPSEMAVTSPPIPDEATVEQVLDLVGTDQANGIFLTTDDIRASIGQSHPLTQPTPVSGWERGPAG